MIMSNSSPKNILSFLQDKSITNILKYIFNKNNIELTAYTPNLPLENYTFHLALLDESLSTNQKNDFHKHTSQTTPDLPLLLAINKNYKELLTTSNNPNIIGITYKPFDAEELLEIIQLP